MKFDIARRSIDGAWLVWRPNGDQDINMKWTIFAVCEDRPAAVAAIAQARSKEITA